MTSQMGEHMRRRLEALRAELKAGAEQQEALQRRHQELGQTMLRIDGAIQVLEEALAEEASAQEASSVGQGP